MTAATTILDYGDDGNKQEEAEIVERYYMETVPWVDGYHSAFYGVYYRILDRKRKNWHLVFTSSQSAKAKRWLARLNKRAAK